MKVYRILKKANGKHVVQTQGILRGWNTVRSAFLESDIEFDSAEAAETQCRAWHAEDNPQCGPEMVVKEITL